MDETTRLQVIESLERLAQEPGWNAQFWQQCYDLVEANRKEALLAYVHDDLIHYSGVFHEHNLLGLRVKPDEGVLEDYRREFRNVVAALRSGLTLSEARDKFDL